jgi:hypothetical protein
MTVAQDVSEKLIALGNWLAEARRELERELDRALDSQGSPAIPAEVVHRDWCMMAIGQLEVLRHVAGYVLSTIDVAYDVGFSDGQRGREATR